MNWFDELFIKEAKAALSNHSGSCSGGGSGGGSSEEWIGDGNTHIWITLQDGRTSPMLGVCPKGTVTVDWGDGTTPDVLTGVMTNAVKWTPNHEYAKAGDYIITLTVDGTMGISGELIDGSYILRHSSSSNGINTAYLNAVRRVEIGSNVELNGDSFTKCYVLSSMAFTDSATRLEGASFRKCMSLTSVTIPDSVTSIEHNMFAGCQSLTSVTIPDSVTSLANNVFSSCYTLSSIVIPNSVTSIDAYAFSYCYSLGSIVIPNGVTRIEQYTFQGCYSLSFVVIPNSLTYIDKYAFEECKSVRYFDFTNHVAVPTLSSTNAFNKIADDCEIRVPAALYDEWIAATNWATYASKIVAV